MPSLKPPYTRKHIIIFGSATFFVAMGLLFWQKDNILDRVNKPTVKIAQATPETIKTTFEQPLKTIQEGKTGLALDKDNLVILDVRTSEEYHHQHIKGSLLTPAAQVSANVFPSTMKVVVYSDNQQEIDQAVSALQKMDLAEVHTLHATLEDLQASGYQLVATPTEDLE